MSDEKQKPDFIANDFAAINRALKELKPETKAKKQPCPACNDAGWVEVYYSGYPIAVTCPECQESTEYFSHDGV